MEMIVGWGRMGRERKKKKMKREGCIRSGMWEV